VIDESKFFFFFYLLIWLLYSFARERTQVLSPCIDRRRRRRKIKAWVGEIKTIVAGGYS
jgi:hypothetical protein